MAETVLKIKCAPITWPVGMGKRLKGIYHLYQDKVILYEGSTERKVEYKEIQGLDNPELDELLSFQAKELRDEIELEYIIIS